MEIDITTEFGQRVRRRLEEETVIWLTTVDSRGRPQPRPVWFLWDGDSLLIYSRPDTAKLSHIALNPQVALHFDSDGRGGDIVVFTGQATVDEQARPVHEVREYADKYRQALNRMGSSPQEMARDYTVALRVRPLKVRGH